MSQLFTQFLGAVAEQVGAEVAHALASRQKFCGKLRHWCAADGGTGAGRQWRCANCTAQRRAAMARKKASS